MQAGICKVQPHFLDLLVVVIVIMDPPDPMDPTYCDYDYDYDNEEKSEIDNYPSCPYAGGSLT